jgi:predicted MPP superfamily phosphohydrolase
MALDRVFSPRDWAARLAYAVGLQSGRTVEVERHLIPVAHPRSGPPLRIAFASDFHAGATTDRRVLETACAALANLKADVLLLGGDFVTVRASYIRVLAPLLAEIPAPFGRYAVFGNHDLRADTSALRAALSKVDVAVLTNESVRLRAPHDDVMIVGLDDPIRGTPDASMLDSASGVRIVMMHAPDGLLALEDREFDLALCGHTHGGQIVLSPQWIPYLPAGKLSRAYAAGLYRLEPEGRRALLVSRGVGCSTVPIRVRSPAQVHLVTVG